MEMAKRLLFETPLAVYIVLAAAEGAVFAIWTGRRTQRWKRALLVTPVLAGAIGLMSWLVETDREQITSALKILARSIEADGLNEAVEYFDPECQALPRGRKTLGKEEIIKRGREALKRWPVKRFIVNRPELNIDGDSATTRIKTRIILETGYYLDAEWRMKWARRQAGWRIVSIEALSPPKLANWNI